MTDGASPKVSIWFDQPLTVKGPWYQPDVKISSIWLDGDQVKTDASFSTDALNSVPGLGSLPDKMASKAIAQAEGSFAPLMQLLHAQAAAGHLADPTAVAAALGQALDPATLANAPANPLAGKVDVSQSTVTASATLKGAFSQTENGVVVSAPAGMTVTANLPVNGSTQAVRGPLTLSFSPGIQVSGAGTGLGADLVNLANASVTGITVAPDGRVTLGGDSIGIAKGVLDDRLSEESQRATAILAVVLRELPPGSPIAEALAKAGVRPS
jgi:hypothetical protein